MSLEVGAIYIILFARPTEPGTYHWGLYHHCTPPSPIARYGSGYRFHVTNAGSLPGQFVQDFGMTSGALISFALVGLIKIGQLDPAYVAHLRMHLEQVDCTSPSPDIIFSCQVWVLKAIALLIHLGVVHCNDINALEREVCGFADQEWANAEGNKQPRPIVQSNVCTFA
ncbi:uncharacterized protein BT62DRAFT_970494 [Guyanagaster necrorhizus]|uniref:Uncharacterized protein n=1 Tax=Guyanagaster necrorhizus TaxID=856835 RepID=A0A9P7VQ99_9AGAR|nr:uncharacterized protein BT62DRAFT_970494 [Guyanagaster necrorhizus MCA 3950]KAG7444612.1 hypothetical protein BT62DRAFT_970494 [Guyanagaster necrorhizus MCA 3950]